jgi:hypothetical protein
VTSLDVIESLPPGLYEMKLKAKAGMEEQRWDQLEPGNYTVHYEFRTMDDIRAINPEGRDEEAMFSTISQVSEFNANLYKTWMRPMIKMMATRQVADAMGKLNPMRLQRQVFSDFFPLAPFIHSKAKEVRANRVEVAPDHPLRQLEKTMDKQITEALNRYRDQRDAQTVAWARQMFGPQGLGLWIKPKESDGDIAVARAWRDLDSFRESVLNQIADGGFPEAVCRIVLAGMISIGSFERRSLRLARLLAQLPSEAHAGIPKNIDWVRLLKEQARITAVAPVEALNALAQLLPDTDSREHALALSAAVMMIEPTLANPRSEIIELVIGMLGVDPERVIALARKLTDSVENVPEPVKAKKRTRAKADDRAAPAA